MLWLFRFKSAETWVYATFPALDKLLDSHQRILFKDFSKINKKPKSYSIFTSRSKALTWLKEFGVKDLWKTQLLVKSVLNLPLFNGKILETVTVYGTKRPIQKKLWKKSKEPVLLTFSRETWIFVKLKKMPLKQSVEKNLWSINVSSV